MRTITVAIAKDFRGHLLETLADNTFRRRCGRVKQFFSDALLRGLVDCNPFVGQKVSVGASKSERIHYIPREDSNLILKACPDAKWRLIFVLCRFAGMRCPSEVLHLRWDDIDWKKSRITFRSIKTEHHEGGETRTIPIFPELVKPLRDIEAERTEEPSDRILSRHQPDANLRTQFLRIVEKSGVKLWAKPFQNLRSTRETELMNDFPIHVVCKWIDNSIQVAAKHYLQVTEE